MLERMQPITKFLIILAVLGLAVFGLVKLGVFKPSTTKATTKSEISSPKKSGGLSNLFKGNSGENLTIIVNTWGGFAPLAYLNGGSLNPNPESIITKKYGINLTIKICDAFEESRNIFKSGNGDIVYCTFDALPTEMGANSAMVMYNAQGFIQVDWSRGGDLIVVIKNIRTVADLRGKTIAVAEGTASNTFLIKTLEANGLQMSDVNIKPVKDGIEAAALFKAGTVDAAVIWTPDDGDCLEAIQGSKVLVSTSAAKFIIADGLLASKDFIEKNHDLLVKFSTAWLATNGEINNTPSIKAQAAVDFAKAFGVKLDYAQTVCDKVRLTTLGDNQNFFGLNPTYIGVTGEQLYSKMSIKYSDVKLTSHPLAWRSVSNTSIVEAINLTGSAQEAESATTFTAPTAVDKTKQAVSSKKVSINFATGSALLSDDAKSIIDREIGGLAKDFAGFRMRIEGNTDAVGNQSMNLALSFKRAQAVADYLVSEYRFDPNRFIVQGNGSKQAIAAGVMSANENYRRTDFQFVE
jgi:NitT/TauT family transport system substrate-binding protein